MYRWWCWWPLHDRKSRSQHLSHDFELKAWCCHCVKLCLRGLHGIWVQSCQFTIMLTPQQCHCTECTALVPHRAAQHHAASRLIWDVQHGISISDAEHTAAPTIVPSYPAPFREDGKALRSPQHCTARCPTTAQLHCSNSCQLLVGLRVPLPQ